MFSTPWPVVKLKCHKTWFRFLSPAKTKRYFCSEIYKAFQDRLTFNRHMIVWFSWIFSVCEIFYWEYRTAGHLVFWKPWPVTGHIATAFLYYCILIFFVIFSYSWDVSLARTARARLLTRFYCRNENVWTILAYTIKAWIRSFQQLYCIQWIEKR